MGSKDNFEFQVVASLASGLLFGPFSHNILTTIIFVIIYEFAMFHYTEYYPPKVRALDRVVVNLFFFFGWCLGRILMRNETGFDGFWEDMPNDALHCNGC